MYRTVDSWHVTETWTIHPCLTWTFKGPRILCFAMDTNFKGKSFKAQVEREGLHEAARSCYCRNLLAINCSLIYKIMYSEK